MYVNFVNKALEAGIGGAYLRTALEERIGGRHRRSVLEDGMKTQDLRERDIEAYLRDRVRTRGGVAYKFTSPGNAGVPDRLVLLPNGRVVFVELKAPGKTSTPLQVKQQRRIANLGHRVCVLDSKEKVDGLLQEVTPK